MLIFYLTFRETQDYPKNEILMQIFTNIVTAFQYFDFFLLLKKINISVHYVYCNSAIKIYNYYYDPYFVLFQNIFLTYLFYNLDFISLWFVFYK